MKNFKISACLSQIILPSNMDQNLQLHIDHKGWFDLFQIGKLVLKTCCFLTGQIKIQFIGRTRFLNSHDS